MILLSVLIPTKGRKDKLDKAMQSWLDCSPHGSIEFILRFHQCEWPPDPERLKSDVPTICMVGRDKEPGELNGFLWSEMIPKASGRWVQFWSDDITVKGNWAPDLMAMDEEGLFVQPKNHQLNQSLYENQADGPVPFIPLRAIKKYGLEKIDPVPDLFYYRELVLKRNWTPVYLNGLTITHHREIDSTLPAHEY